jgi:hypothetical protein
MDDLRNLAAAYNMLTSDFVKLVYEKK